MLNGEVIVATLKELIRKADSTDKRLGLLDASEAAHRRMICGGEFPSELVAYALIVGLRTKKPRLSETCLGCLHHVLQVRAIPPLARLGSGDAMNADGSPAKGRHVVDVLTLALCDTISDVVDGSVQLKALDCLALCALDERYVTITESVLTRVLQSCFNVSLTCTNVAVQISSAGVLKNIISQRVARLFVLQSAASSASPPRQFSCSTMLDFGADYDPTDNYVELDVPYEEQETTPQSALSILPDLAPASRDLFNLMRTLCTLATTAIPSDVVSIEALEVRTRTLALKLLRFLLAELPPMNCEAECAAAESFGRVLAIVKMDLWRCVTRNLATIMPPQLFDWATDILTELCIKAHYHLAGELHLLLCTIVLPIVQSRFSTFQQKLSVLAMVRQIVAKPAVVVAYFINYDCNPRFEETGRYGGLLEVILDFLVEMVHIDFTAKDWFTEEQGILLRNECIKAMRDFAASLRRWIADDPKSLLTGAGALSNSLNGVGSSFAISSGQVYFATTIPAAARSHLDSDDDADDDDEFETSHSHSTFSRGRRPPPLYHWKHVHQLLCNKKIIETAISRFNTNWRHGRKYLEDKGVIPAGDDVAFARFLRQHPAMERSQVRVIFEKVIKDEQALRILEAYLTTFTYHGVSLDVALRDTTCEFMSWDSVNFEAPVWGKIQEAFGREYARQNSDAAPGSPFALSPRDADALAGVCLFLHTSLHNRNVGADRMHVESFIRFGGDCLETPLPVEEMRAIYGRVGAQKWAPKRRLVKVTATTSSEFHAGRSSVPSSSPATPPTAGSDSSPARAIGALSERDTDLLDGNMATYTNNMQHFRITQQNQLAYIRVANEHLRVFETELAAYYSRKSHRLPFIVPQHAQHARPIMLMFYPHVASTLYVALRLAAHEPIFVIVDEVYETLFDVAAAFVINLADLYPAVERITQRCLRQDSAVRLGTLSSALCPFLMNRV